jgi:short-subunit dehydrogenase
MITAREGGLAVVTGGAGGLGSTFAKKLAERGHRLLLVDRRPQQLEDVCQSITERYGVAAEPCAMDLCNRHEVEELAKRLERMGDVELLVNNAGFGTIDYFVDCDARCVTDMVDVHVVAPTILTRAVLPGMVERNRGAIINLSSVAAWLHSAGNVAYGSTKCYLAVFSMALQQELRGTNVRVQALCPGLIRTEFHNGDGMKQFDQRYAPAGHLWMTPEEVVNCSLRRLYSKQVIVIPGFGYSIFGRLAQMPILQPLMQWVTRGPRVAPAPAPAIEPCPEPAFMASEPGFAVAEVTETAAAS